MKCKKCIEHLNTLGDADFDISDLESTKVPNIQEKFGLKLSKTLQKQHLHFPPHKVRLVEQLVGQPKLILAKAKAYQGDWAGAEPILMDIINNGPFESNG